METTCWCCGSELDEDEGATGSVAGEVACAACARWSAHRGLEEFLGSRWLARRRAIMGRERLARAS